MHLYQTESRLEHAIGKLLNAGRPYAAVNCLYCQRHKTGSFGATLAVRAVMDALSSKEAVAAIGQHHFH